MGYWKDHAITVESERDRIARICRSACLPAYADRPMVGQFYGRVRDILPYALLYVLAPRGRRVYIDSLSDQVWQEVATLTARTVAELFADPDRYDLFADGAITDGANEDELIGITVARAYAGEQS